MQKNNRARLRDHRLDSSNRSARAFDQRDQESGCVMPKRLQFTSPFPSSRTPERGTPETVNLSNPATRKTFFKITRPKKTVNKRIQPRGTPYVTMSNYPRLTARKRKNFCAKWKHTALNLEKIPRIKKRSIHLFRVIHTIKGPAPCSALNASPGSPSYRVLLDKVREGNVSGHQEDDRPDFGGARPH